ncbi:MAG: phage protease [Phycisphaerae bacterium]
MPDETGTRTAPAATDVESMAFHAGDALPDDLPRRILVAPFGDVVSTNGSFVVDAEAMDATVAAFRTHATDLPVDFEHQTLGGAFSSPNGLAPAAGWIKSLRAVTPRAAIGSIASSRPAVDGAGEAASSGDDGEPSTAGLWADVEWTTAAMELLRTKQYRYLSPVALVRRSDRRMVGLHSVALTNKPAIVGMRPVVARFQLNRIPVELHGDELERLRALLAVEADAGADVVLAVAADRIQALQTLMDTQAAVHRVDRAAAAGKLAPTQRTWAFDLALRDADAFESWLAATPVVLTLGKTRPPDALDASSAVGGVERRAREEFRRNAAFLGRLCTEEAFVANAVRAADRAAAPSC